MLQGVRLSGSLRSTLIHLRLPFFFFLMPIWLAALASLPRAGVDWAKATQLFVIFHFLLYPASNGFNSYFDRDEGPIGGIAKPPEVDRSLLVTCLCLDALGLAWSFLEGPLFGLAALVYGTGSKLYSWDRIRIKKRPILGWLMTGFGQGAFTLLSMAIVAGGGLSVLAEAPVLWGAGLITAFLLGVYPLTQIYQHEEDARRGDLTISRLAGIRGTFVLAAAFLGLASLGFVPWISAMSGPLWAASFLLANLPALGYFLAWARRAFRDPNAADFRSTMAMNLLASGFMNAWFILYLILRQA